MIQISVELIFRILAFVMTIILVAVKFIFSLLLFRKYYENKENRLILAFAVLFLLIGIGRIFFIYFDYFLTNFDSTLYIMYGGYWKLASIFPFIGFIFVVFMAEKEIYKAKTKYLVGIFGLVFIVISMVIPDLGLAQVIGGIPTVIALLFIPISYLYLGIISEGEIRKKSFIIFIGITVYLLGYIILAEVLLDVFIMLFVAPEIYMRYILHVVSIGFKLVGIIILISGFMRN